MSTLQIDLLSAWRNVSAGALQLLEAVEQLPEECRCSNGNEHFDQNCECCGGHERMDGHSGSDENCSVILSRLRADTALLAKDFSALAGPLELAAFATRSVELPCLLLRASIGVDGAVEGSTLVLPDSMHPLPPPHPPLPATHIDALLCEVT